MLRSIWPILLSLFLVNQLQSQETPKTPSKPKTNLEDALKTPRKPWSLPGLFPGKVVAVDHPKATVERKPDAALVKAMVTKGVESLTGKDPKGSFQMLFNVKDIVGIKVNPVGAKIISTHLEVVDALVDWLTASGLPKSNIVIWDRFDYMLRDAGYTPERYPGIAIVGLQTMDEEAAEGKAKDDSRWLKDGKHVSESQFDLQSYYWADVDGPKDKPYLNQHVFNGKHSYFGKLLTQKLTKIINVPVFKNTGNGVSMATKNLGYGSICNTGRLHQPLFFDVCTEVLAFPPLRDKVVLNVMDGLVGQFEGGPMPDAQKQWEHRTIYFATDPFALDTIGHQRMVEKRKEAGVKVNEHPRFTEYLRYAQRLGLGIADPAKIQVVEVHLGSGK